MRLPVTANLRDTHTQYVFAFVFKMAASRSSYLPRESALFPNTFHFSAERVSDPKEFSRTLFLLIIKFLNFHFREIKGFFMN